MFNAIPVKGGFNCLDDFYSGGIHAGFKPNEELDLGFIRSDKPCSLSYLFTKNRFKAAPLKHVLQNGFKQCDFILLNSKNANALTGEQGLKDVDTLLEHVRQTHKATSPIMSSTGVIGVCLDTDKLKNGINNLDINEKNSHAAAKAIMTTDSGPKECAYEVELDDGSSFKVAGIAKGAGMIDPSMATMLCFIATDADIPDEHMHTALKEANEISFNAISVDGDRSTNDSVFLMSSKSGAYEQKAFQFALDRVMQELALKIVGDGEGATKLAAFHVKGAKDDYEAKLAAKKLSNSLLVKTALFGQDPNWGRIASTIGASEVTCSEESLRIFFDDLLIYDKGSVYFDQENENKAAEIMGQSSFKITCDLGAGEGEYTAYGCDLGYEYVKINADYRT